MHLPWWLGGAIDIHVTGRPRFYRLHVRWTVGLYLLDDDAIGELDRLLPVGTMAASRSGTPAPWPEPGRPRRFRPGRWNYLVLINSLRPMKFVPSPLLVSSPEHCMP